MTHTLRKISIFLLVLMLSAFCLISCGGNDTPTDSSSDTETDSETKVVYSLEIRADKTVALRGENVNLSAFFKGDETEEDITSEATFTIVEGSDIASITANVLSISKNATHGSVIKVKAVDGATTSNELAITVKVPATELEIGPSDVTNILAGQSQILSATIKPTGAESDVVYSIIEGAESADIQGNVLVVKNGAKTGAKIKVQATVGEKESNVLTFTVGYPLTDLEIESAVTNILEGSTAQLFVTKTPANATDADYKLEVVEGKDYVIVMGDTITVKAGTPTGTKIKVKAVSGEIESDAVEFTVGYPLEEIKISLVGSTNIEPGKTAEIKVTLNPTNTTNGDHTWEFTAGGELADMVGDTIVIDDDAPIGSIIKLVAKTATKTSNEITITVGTPITNVTLSTTAPEVLERGESYEFDVDVDPDDATLSALEWGVTDKDGKKVDFATIKDGVLTIGKNAPAGTQIIVYAASGSVKDEMTFTVGVALEKIDISIGGSTENINIDPGATSAITSVLTPSNASDTEINWVITEGNDYATITNGFITINADAPIGAVVKFHAEIVGITSDDIAVTVGTPITGIEINALKTDIVKGEGTTLSAILTPSNASTSLIKWEIIDGNEFAELVGTNLMIKADATTGETITVRASFGDVSDEIVFTVMPTQAEIDATTYRLSLSAPSVNFDKYGTSAPVIKATVYDRNYNVVEGLDIEFDVVEGDNLFTFTQNGAVCTLNNAVAHGTAKIRARIVGRDDVAFQDATINVIVPPERIDLNGVFKENPKLEFSFSKVDSLPFSYTTVPAAGTTPCQDVAYTFTAEDGTTGDDVAVYEDGKITFKKTGKITLDITSTAGSRKEASVKYAFDINEGFNVETYEELSKIINATEINGDGHTVSKYKGEPINLVVLDKVIGVDPETGVKDYNYGYALVPTIALNNMPKDQSINEIIPAKYNSNGETIKLRLQAINTSLFINGNNTTIDVSNIRVTTLKEYDQYRNDTNDTNVLQNLNALLSAETYQYAGNPASTVEKQDYFVKLFDLKFKGNVPYNYNPADYSRDGSTNRGLSGGYSEAVSIGSLGYTTHYTATVDNLSANAFYNAFKFTALVDSRLSNLKADNCYSTGVTFRSCIATLENLTVQMCGATGIEISEDEDTQAGKYDNQKAQVILMGKINATNNLNAGDSNYFNNYIINIPGMGEVPAMNIIQGAISNHPDQIHHIRNGAGQFNFIALKFVNVRTLDSNETEVIYSAFDEGGIIKIEDIPAGETDTTHQFIQMEIEMSGMSLGTAIFYNHHYVKPAN